MVLYTLAKKQLYNVVQRFIIAILNLYLPHYVIMSCVFQAGGCYYGTNMYYDGDDFPCSDGCNRCRCRQSKIMCTKVMCHPGSKWQFSYCFHLFISDILMHLVYLIFVKLYIK